VADPVLHVIAGPNGAGKTTFYARILEPATHLEFVNADIMAAEHWPGAEVEHAYDAAALAAAVRAERIDACRSFVTETVFSHESKVALLRDAEAAGYRVSLHIVLIPEDLAAARVVDRVTHGGHHVPEDKIRARFTRLWSHLRHAVDVVDDAHVYDNTRADEPFRLVASFLDGRLIDTARWPRWTPEELRAAGR
jgi:predicted ABC-type ATPase